MKNISNINFTAKLIPLAKGQEGEAFQNFHQKQREICDVFKKNTSSYPNQTLYVEDFEQSRVTLEENGIMQARHSFQIKPPKDNARKIAQYFTDIFDLMQLKSNQNKEIENLKAKRKAVDQKYKTAMQNACNQELSKLKIIREKTLRRYDELIKGLSRIHNADFNSALISKGLSNKF